jgi:hypothetical protein
MAPAIAGASCTDRKVAGTVVGGVGGALIGNSIAHGGGGAVVGGLGGAVLGHEVARASCRHESHYGQAEYDHRYRHSHSGYGANPGQANQAGAYPSGDQYGQPPQQTLYYDDRGRPVSPTVGATYASAPGPSAQYAPPATYAGYAPGAPACGAETRTYYNDRGQLVQGQVQTCAP